MEKGTVYFFTGLSGAGKTTIGGLFYRRLKERRNGVVLLDGDQLRRLSFNKQSGYTTEERRAGAFYNFEMCNMLADQGIDVVLCSISMYNDCRAWAREHIENYLEIYIKVKRETLYSRDQKGLYSSGAKNVVGVDLLCEEPERPDVIIQNDGQETPEEIVSRLETLVFPPSKGAAPCLPPAAQDQGGGHAMRFYFEEAELWKKHKNEIIQEINRAGVPLALFGRVPAANPDFLREITVPVEYIISNHPASWGKKLWGLEVVGPERLQELYPDYTVLILAVHYSREFTAQMEAFRVPPRKIFALDLRYEQEDIAGYFKSKQDVIAHTYEAFADQLSKDTYEALLRYRINRDPSYLRPVARPEEEEYILKTPDLPDFWGPEEVFVDVGAYTGDTVQKFAEAVRGQYNAIYAFEPEPQNYRRLLEATKGMWNVFCRQTGAGEGPEQIRFLSSGQTSCRNAAGEVLVQVDSLDNQLKDVPVTYIKMDIEGMECPALRGAKGLLAKYRPKLAICGYHSMEDMVMVPKLIRELNPNYRIFMRHYCDNAIQQIVCYAV